MGFYGSLKIPWMERINHYEVMKKIKSQEKTTEITWTHIEKEALGKLSERDCVS